MTTQTRIELFTDAAALVRLLGQVANAFMLDEHDKVEMLLGQVTQPACNRVAGELMLLNTFVNDEPEGEPVVHGENVVDILTRRRTS